MQKCASCGGTYETDSPAGVRYFHGCPPLAVWEIRAAIARGGSPLTAAQTAQLATADKIPPPIPAPADYVPVGDRYLATLTIARPNARNENIDPVKVAAAPKDALGNVKASVQPETLMVSAGAGVTAVADAAL